MFPFIFTQYHVHSIQVKWNLVFASCTIWTLVDNDILCSQTSITNEYFKSVYIIIVLWYYRY